MTLGAVWLRRGGLAHEPGLSCRRALFLRCFLRGQCRWGSWVVSERALLPPLAPSWLVLEGAADEGFCFSREATVPSVPFSFVMGLGLWRRVAFHHLLAKLFDNILQLPFPG